MTAQDIFIILEITKKRQNSFMKTKQRNLSKKEKEKQKPYGKNGYKNLFKDKKEKLKKYGKSCH